MKWLEDLDSLIYSRIKKIHYPKELERLNGFVLLELVNSITGANGFKIKANDREKFNKLVEEQNIEMRFNDINNELENFYFYRPNKDNILPHSQIDKANFIFIYRLEQQKEVCLPVIDLSDNNVIGIYDVSVINLFDKENIEWIHSIQQLNKPEKKLYQNFKLKLNKSLVEKLNVFKENQLRLSKIITEAQKVAEPLDFFQSIKSIIVPNLDLYKDLYQKEEEVNSYKGKETILLTSEWVQYSVLSESKSLAKNDQALLESEIISKFEYKDTNIKKTDIHISNCFGEGKCITDSGNKDEEIKQQSPKSLNKQGKNIQNNNSCEQQGSNHDTAHFSSISSENNKKNLQEGFFTAKEEQKKHNIKTFTNSIGTINKPTEQKSESSEAKLSGESQGTSKHTEHLIKIPENNQIKISEFDKK